VIVQGHELTVEEMRGRKITRVRIQSTATPTDTPNDGNNHR
jgi:hypothetical protein